MMAKALTSVFFVLCALASVSIAVPSGPSEAFCVDLTTGKTSVLPGNTAAVSWIKTPTSNGERCNLQGVLKIKPPNLAQSVSFHMAFEKSNNYSFNIGDSKTNNGLGGDSGTTVYDAEIHSNGNSNSNSNTMYVYGSDVGGSNLMTSSNAVKTAMLIRLSKMQMYATNYEGYSYYKQDKGLFAFDTMYMGLNRVVHNINGYPSAGRTGRGLCSVCIYFLKDTVKDLHGPTLTIEAASSVLEHVRN